MSQMIALVDCNNFYVSCERVFDPSLLHRPVKGTRASSPINRTQQNATHSSLPVSL